MTILIASAALLSASGAASIPRSTLVAVEHNSKSRNPEEVFDEIWSQPIPSLRLREKVGGWRIPIMSEIHNYIIHDLATPRTAHQELQISGLFKNKYPQLFSRLYTRVTCRPKACEYVIISTTVPDDVSLERIAQFTTKMSEFFCKPAMCQSAIAVTGRKETKFALLGYYIYQQIVTLDKDK